MLSQKKLFLFDIDGTIAIGNQLYESSDKLLSYIENIGGKAYYITNNSTKSGKDYVKKFADFFHVEATEEQFITSGTMTLRFLKKHFPYQKIFVLGTSSFLKELRKNGLTVTEQAEPDIACVVAAYDSELTYSKLTAVCQVLSSGDIPFYATNPDLCCPVDFGFIPDCGAICKMIEYSTKRVPVYLGKPSRKVVDYCLQASGFTPDETIVIGDRLYTDIACGINAGVDTCVVFTGEATPAETAASEFIPTYAFDTIADFYHALIQK